MDINHLLVTDMCIRNCRPIKLNGIYVALPNNCLTVPRSEVNLVCWTRTVFVQKEYSILKDEAIHSLNPVLALISILELRSWTTSIDDTYWKGPQAVLYGVEYGLEDQFVADEAQETQNR